MLQVVVFDNGFGGELFADKLEAELPVVEVIRVIDWRNAEIASKSHRVARKTAEQALRFYIGKVDLIIFANYLLSATSLKYFRRKYKNQKFIGFSLQPIRTVLDRPTLVLTTKAITRSITFFNLTRRLKIAKVVCLDHWPFLISDGKLTKDNLVSKLEDTFSEICNFSPEQILLGCGEFSGFKPEFREVFGPSIRIVDSFDQTVREVYRALGLRGLPKLKS